MIAANRLHPIWIGALLLIAAFALMLADIQQQSLWLDEAWTVHAVHDAGRAPEGIRDTLRYLRDSLLHVLEQVRGDVHPPLYFLLMDSWTLLTGESELALRLPSALAGLIAAAGIAGIGRMLSGKRAGWFALILLVTSGFFLQYAQEARMYALLLALVTLALLAFLHYEHRPQKRAAALLILALTLALYTHYVAVLLLVAFLSYALLMRRWRALILLLIPAGLLLPWLPFAINQWNAHPQGAAALPLESGIGTLAALWLLLTSGYWFNFLLPLALAIPALLTVRPRRELFLLLLWGLLPVLVLFVLNAQGISVLQIRYLIPLLLTWVLLLAWALDHIRLPRFSQGITLLLVLWLAFTQLSMRDDLWYSKPRWREAVAEAAAVRSPLEPIVLHIPPDSPAAYYDRRFDLTAGYTLNIGWQRFAPAEIGDLLHTLDAVPAIWATLPMQDPSSWDAIMQLSQERGAGYRDSVQGTIFYRFDADHAGELQFAFGDAALDWSPQQWTVSAGEPLCVATGLPSATGGTMLLTLTRGYHEIVAQLEANAAPEACFDLPEQLPQDDLHVRLYLLDDSGTRLPLIESGHYWGDFLILGTVKN